MHEEIARVAEQTDVFPEKMYHDLGIEHRRAAEVRDGPAPICSGNPMRRREHVDAITEVIIMVWRSG